ncbi:Holliday junction resolvase RuvX [Tessaracoccus sp. OH4464_COT-324]|uniref:Holliday junction resolvase RuvX n=1 Tax=Tessaracoccus sp. OH4464_COT-324 TaxID=2491059 RepID=UPI000F633470|nr:Holliday junction resolvase RuvX [Tessaracoccus sp. OH4464_COT-324]RRD47958.1 Holliday junction resolvase RuvX [Tessaracoccus sp. OH4464_COT-324]
MPDRARLAIDWGKARIGVAASAAHTSFAYPVATVAAGEDEFRELLALIEEHRPEVIYVGLPINLRGEHGPAAKFVVGKARALQIKLPDIPIRLVDERMSTAAASRSLGGAGKNTKAQRGIIDQAAAVEILRSALDGEERTGTIVGEAVRR